MPSLTVVVPALNEEENLRPTVESVLKDLGAEAAALEVLIFDDASSDRTGVIADALAAADPRVRAFHNPRRLNIGGSYKAGLRAARGDYVVLIPGDNEISAAQISRGLRHLGEARLVVFHITNVRVRPWSRRALSRLYVWTVNTLFNARFRYTNGTNIFQTALARDLDIRTDGFSYQTEAVVKAVRSGVDFVEVGIELKVREFGASKAVTWKNFKSVAAALGRLWWDIHVRARGRYRRRGTRLGTF
jgi:glycosyltransferase involved in cell wall biosynthesis